MKALHLKDFRCYTQQYITFKSGVNLLVGDNASGKTSVLKACRYVLGAFFAGFSDENTKWVTLGLDDFRQVVQEGILLPEPAIHIEFDVSDMTNDSQLLPYLLTKKSKKSARSLIGGIRGYRDYAAALQQAYIAEQKQVRALPLFASFSTEDIHASRKINADKFRHYTPKPSFGYYECLDGHGFFPYWIRRLLVLQEGRQSHPEISIVRQAIHQALGPNGCNIIADMHVRPMQGKVYYLLVDGREVEADYLSDGYRRLVNIVTDIAFRCALLNRGIYGEQACALTQGTVLIDEVDLHLHPTLQAVVLRGLRQAFPQLQFIVSSHAPMVMSGVQNSPTDQVYKLDFVPSKGYTLDPVNTYGLDLSTLTQVVLGHTPRAAEVDRQLEQLFALVDQEKKAEAQTLLSVMKVQFGDNLPELAQAQAMLHCLAE